MRTIVFLILLVSGEQSITRQQADQVIATAKAKVAEAGVEVRIEKVQAMRNLARGMSFQSSQVSSQQLAVFNRYRGRIAGYRRAGQFKKNVHIILPPMIDEAGTRWLGGASSTGMGCYGLAISVSNAVERSIQGTPRIERSGLTAAHEFFHDLGATHNDTSLNIMSTGFSGDTRYWQVPVLPQTIAQISSCKF